jgi:cytochrome P450
VQQCLSDRTALRRTLASKPGTTSANTRKDFFYWLFAAQDPETGKRYSLSELYAECEMLVIAGSDTTANVLSALFFYLARNPRIQAKLATELRSAFPAYADIKAGEQMHACKYLTAVIQESLSADPAREVLHGGAAIDGYFFPAGTNVSTEFWAMHYNAEYFAVPYEFRPERWIPGHEGVTGKSVERAESAFCAFLAGTRGCVGKNLA